MERDARNGGAPGGGAAGADPVPAVAEADAEGETAEIYADIRAALGIGVVNLVWRHLATIGGALPWAWRALRPVYASGAAAREGAALFDDLDLPVLPPFPPSALRLAGAPERDMGAIAAVLESYNRGNGTNLVALSALSAAPSDAPPAAGPPPAAIATPIPPLPPLDGLEPDVRALVMALSEFGARPGDRIVPSLYRHLAHWPGFLALAWTAIAPLHADGRLHRLADAAREAGLARGGRLAAEIDAGPAPPGAEAAIEEFRRSAIGRMVPIAMMLRRAIR